MRHFVTNYYYLLEEEMRVATVEASDNLKKLYNCNLVMAIVRPNLQSRVLGQR